MKIFVVAMMAAAGAATALLGMSDRLDPSELDEIEAMIARARAAKSGGTK